MDIAERRWGGMDYTTTTTTITMVLWKQTR
jgi:hypothetical protein